MEPVQSKALRKTIYCFLLFLILRVIEEIIIIPRAGASTKSVIACLGGLIILFIFIRFDNKPLDGIGLLFSPRKIGKGFGLALALNAIVAFAVFSAELFQFKSYEGTSRLTLYYSSTDHAFSAGIKGFLLWTGFAAVVAVIHAIFYELAFRGLLFTLASRGMKFSAVNALQAGLYVVWFMIPALRILLNNLAEYGRSSFVIFVLFTVVYELLTAVKLGMLRKASGAIWVCIFDHMAFSFILDMVHLQHTNAAFQVTTDANYYVRLFAYQAISLLISVIYFQSKTKKINAKQQAAALENKLSDDDIV